MIKTIKKKTYGNTWWGSKWREALERIDSNRLARGKTYANTDKVKNIVIEKSKLSAKVSGVYATYYNIKLSLIKFTKEEINIIKELVKNNTSIALELSRGNIPDNLLSLLEESNINLFPERWHDINAKCSCPDSANPCKHLAAVYYMIANEIDKDPFLLFDLKGLNRKDLQKSAGVIEPNDNIYKVTFYHKFLEKDYLNMETKEYNPDDFNFNFEKGNPQLLVSLLQDKPSFYNEGNFKNILEGIYNTVSKNLDEALSSIKINYEKDNNKYFLLIKEYEHKKSILKPVFFVQPAKDNLMPLKKYLDSFLESTITYSKQPLYLKNNSIRRTNINVFDTDKILISNKNVKINGYEVSSYPVIDYFLSLPLKHDDEINTDSFIFFNVLSSMAINIVKANMYIPEIIYDIGFSGYNNMREDPQFRIRYIPFMHNDLIKSQIKNLENIMPPAICMMKDKYLDKTGVIDLLAIFITHLVNRVFYITKPPVKNKLVESFLYKSPFHASQYHEKNIAQSLENWLEKLYISKKDIVPVIRLEVADNEMFQVFVDVMDKTKPLEKHVTYSELFTDLPQKKKRGRKKKNPSISDSMVFERDINKVKVEVSKQLIIASDYMSQLREIVDSKGLCVPLISLQEMGDLLTKTLGIFNFLGIEITLPKELKKLAYPQLYCKARISKKATVESFLSTDDLLSFSYEISLGGEKISEIQFRKLLKSAEGLIKYKDKYLLLKPDEVQNILQRLKEPIPQINSSTEALFAAMSGEINGLKFDPDQTLKNILADLTKIEDIEIPEKLKATLRSYQIRGFKWMYSNCKKNLGCCIADDMGLGKTIQVISLILKNKEEGSLKAPALVICPTTLVGNWYKECEKFAPDLNIEVYHGLNRNLQYKKADVIISTYGVLRRDLKKLQSKNWSYLIIDEAQNIKNADTDQTKAVKSIKANNYIAMTGTPVENRLSELWNIFDFINKGYMGNISGFTKTFSTPIERYKDIDSIERLKKSTAPFLIRRLKTDKSIISDLPDKVTIDEYCYLSKEQAAIYENIVQNTLKTIREKDGIERKGLIFKLITSLKQVCNHPANFNKAGNIESAVSGKTQKAISLIENIIANNEKLLIFTQYKVMGDLLVEMLKNELDIDSLFFHGGLTRKKRDEMIDLFQTNRHKKLMILSLKAGGTGLNLTAASNVIHYDLWWNPAVENQATDRVYRIGQDKKVNVHRLITLGTFEEKIDEIIKSKKELADLTVSTGEKWISEFSNTELQDIFSLSQV